MNVRPYTDSEIETVTGEFLDLVRPEPAMINHYAVAQGLGRHPRWAGQTMQPYSVAEHSVLVSHLAMALERDGTHHFEPVGLPLNAEDVATFHTGVRSWGLLHDAAEAYLGDMTAPAKRAMRELSRHDESPYDRLEFNLMHAILRYYGQPIQLNIPERVKFLVSMADRWAFCIEARHLVPSGGQGPHYNVPENIRALGGLPEGVQWRTGLGRKAAARYWMGEMELLGLHAVADHR